MSAGLRVIGPAADVGEKIRRGWGGIHPATELLPDLAQLGVGHITLNISLGGLVSLHEGQDTLPHVWAGRTYFFRRQSVQVYDRVLEFAANGDRGHGDHPGAAVGAIFRFGQGLDAHPQAEEGVYSMANVTTPEGVRHYAATIRFLAERYGPVDSPHGRICNWIIHNEVDAGWVWTNAGRKSAEDYMAEYVKSLRIAYYAARSFDPHAQVFISLTHHWNQSHRPTDPRFYSGRTMLELLNRWTCAEGDFQWGLAYHPYSENLFNPRTWEDRQSQDSFESPMITFRNLQVLDRWMKQADYRYQGNQIRSIFLSEQGFHTPDASPASQRLQAAAIVYALAQSEGPRFDQRFPLPPLD